MVYPFIIPLLTSIHWEAMPADLDPYKTEPNTHGLYRSDKFRTGSTSLDAWLPQKLILRLVVLSLLARQLIFGNASPTPHFATKVPAATYV